MKKLIKVLLIGLLTFGVSFNVLAEGDVVENKNNDATLKNVKINGNNVVCSKQVCKYEVSDASVDSVKITYETNNEKASVDPKSIEGNLKSGENSYLATVTAEDGTELKYTFIVNKKALSSDNSLKKLVINNQEITLKNDVLKYTTSVSYAAKKIEIEATPNNKEAKIVDISTNKVISTNKLTYDFFDDTKEVKVKVKAETGDFKTYTITVTRREEKDANLKSLNITGAKIDFESETYDYEVTVSKSVEKLEVEAVANDTSADVKVDSPTLAIGENTVTITVSNDGNQKTYTIKVNKLDTLDSNLANLKSLKIKDYELDFKEDKYVYDLEIGDVNYLDIDYEVLTPGSTVEITGNMDLEDGSIVKIRVTYNDELTNVYELHIAKVIEEENKNNIPKIIIIIAIILILIAIIVLLIFKFRNKKKDIKKSEDNNKLEVDLKEESKEDIASNLNQGLTTETYSVDDSDIEEII